MTLVVWDNPYPSLDPLDWDVWALEQAKRDKRICDMPRWNNFLTGNWVPCRMCRYCLDRKRRYWTMRILKEAKIWPRTWFVTLTYEDPRDYSYSQVQRWLKRVRAAHGLKFRYVCTTEFESSGARAFNPHHHLAVFSTRYLRRRDLQHKWDNTISQAKLFQKRNAAYIAKYLVKEGARVRASAHIGKGHPPGWKDPEFDDSLYVPF